MSETTTCSTAWNSLGTYLWFCTTFGWHTKILDIANNPRYFTAKRKQALEKGRKEIGREGNE